MLGLRIMTIGTVLLVFTCSLSFGQTDAAWERFDLEQLERIDQLVDAGRTAEVPWSRVVEAMFDPDERSVVRSALATRVWKHGDPAARTELVNSAADLVHRYEHEFSGHLLPEGDGPWMASAMTGMILTQPERVPPDAVESATTLVEFLAVHQGGENSLAVLAHAIDVLDLDPANAGRIAAIAIRSDGGRGLWPGTALVDYLSPTELAQFRTTVREADNNWDAFPFAEAAVLADVGDQQDLAEFEGRARDARAQAHIQTDAADRQRYTRLAEYLERFAVMVRVQSSTDALLAWAISDKPDRRHLRAWAFERGATDEELRVAISTLLDRKLTEHRDASQRDRAMALMVDVSPVRDVLVEHGVLSDADLPEIPRVNYDLYGVGNPD